MLKRQQLRQEAFNVRAFLISLAAIAIVTIVFVFLLPDDIDDYGLLSLIPALFLIGYIFFTKRILEALTLAALLCFAMADKSAFLSGFSSA
ncbi:MAG: hypothetical protein WCR75_12300, partial [Sphaerochaetaceae bacterium]